MPTKPTTTPYQWATNPGTQEAPSAGKQAAGFVGGAPVPDKIHNHMFGTLFAWLVFLWSGLLGGISGEAVNLSAPSAPWLPTTVKPNTTITAQYPNNVTVTENGGDNEAGAIWDHVIASGTIASVATYIGAFSTSAGTPTVQLIIAGFSGGAPTSATYSASVAGGGALTLPLTAGTAPTEGPLTIQAKVTTGTGVGNYIRVDSFTISY